MANNLGGLYSNKDLKLYKDQGKLDEAEKLCHRAVQDRVREGMGPRSHINTGLLIWEPFTRVSWSLEKMYLTERMR